MRRVIVLILAVIAGSPSWTQKAKSTQKPLALMVRRTLGDMGKDAQMPPTLSNLLGLTPNPEIVAVKQVAAKIGITENTVKVHRSRAMEKMQAPSLADLVKMIEKLGLKS